ncbi:hypothetical protein SEA_KING2_41 [Arthrobacter phage King2]|uniref:Uncharacterized protein n=1 Tax=Arthrobacter phage King2 TaxID=2762386 RepID=A0A7G8LQT9_9CAUD|nr:hypothetical protein SEA_KING2_41 [Arthrobacter phage King2]
MTACISTIHETPVEATTRGTFTNVFAEQSTPGIWYCDECAAAGQQFGLFEPDTDAAEQETADEMTRNDHK